MIFINKNSVKITVSILYNIAIILYLTNSLELIFLLFIEGHWKPKLLWIYWIYRSDKTNDIMTRNGQGLKWKARSALALCVGRTWNEKPGPQGDAKEH